MVYSSIYDMDEWDEVGESSRPSTIIFRKLVPFECPSGWLYLIKTLTDNSISTVYVPFPLNYLNMSQINEKENITSDDSKLFN